jgi:oligoendopeptidase F
VIIDEEIKYEWSRIDHFYYNFYVYQYATSFCVANVVAQKIINKDEEILEKYMNFLKSGCSKNANELVLELSINLSTSQIYDQTFMDYENTINEIKQLWSNNA